MVDWTTYDAGYGPSYPGEVDLYVCDGGVLIMIDPTVDLLAWVVSVRSEDRLSRATVVDPLMLSRTLLEPIPCSRFVIRFFVSQGGGF